MAAVTYTLPFAPCGFIEYLLARPDVAIAWKQHTEHVFLERLADGTLPIEAFKYYLIQDYLYLIQFARANSLAGFKTKNLEEIVRSAEIVLHINREMSLHLGYCAEFGLSKEDMLKVEESQACTAYTRFVLDTGSSDDWLALQVALAPCLIGYGVIAKRLYSDPKTLHEGNRYWKWIENYAAEDYDEAVRLGIGRLRHLQGFENSH
jgi:thiaminase II